jgi:hypothetical protein
MPGTSGAIFEDGRFSNPWSSVWDSDSGLVTMSFPLLEYVQLFHVVYEYTYSGF